MRIQSHSPFEFETLDVFSTRAHKSSFIVDQFLPLYEGPGGAPTVVDPQNPNAPNPPAHGAADPDPKQVVISFNTLEEQQKYQESLVRNGINAQRERDIKKLQDRGIELVKDEKTQRVSISKSLDAHAAKVVALQEELKGKGKGGGANPTEPAALDLKTQEHLQELETKSATLEKQVADFKARAESAEAAKLAYVQKNEIVTALGKLPIVQGAFDNAVTLFQSLYDITYTTEGETRVKDKRGLTVNTPEGKPVTVDEATKQFVYERPWLQAAGAGGKASTTKAQEGGGAGREVTKDDLRSGRISPDDILKGKVRVSV